MEALKAITSKTKLTLNSINQLRNETDFSQYLLLLKEFAKRYTVIVASYDTPCGPYFTYEVSKKLMDVGFTTNLKDKFRMSYIAIIDEGNSVYEKVDCKTIKCKFDLSGNSVTVISSGFDESYISSKIIINNKEISGTRGLIFAVFDKITGFIIDEVRFDTYLESFPCERKYNEILKYTKEHKNITVLTYGGMSFSKENLTPNEKLIINHHLLLNNVLNHYDNPDLAIKHYYSFNDLVNVLQVPESYFDYNGTRQFIDYHSKCVNTAGGHRITAYQPSIHNNTIFIVGGCGVFGIGSDDSRTIPSYLQKIINELIDDTSYIVQNYGFFLNQTDSSNNETYKILDSLPVKDGDIVIVDSEKIESIPFINVAFLNNNRNFGLFFDSAHLTPDGNKYIAQKLFEGLVNLNIFNGNIYNTESSYTQIEYGFNKPTSKELNKYKNILRDYYTEKFPERIIGSIVMNCNPFTLGHRYLIEQALEQCDFLMIFVVQEDKSIFPFEDRIRLVDECTADIVNKEVIPSGRFIISSLTFSEYFNKSKMQGRTIDTSLDVTVFAREIAPCLHIKKRFVGEEPNDTVTRQYNETMRRVLPEYGIDLIELPRMKVDGEAISASDVRKLLSEKDFLKIKKLVPEPTYNYLVEKYK